ncbi:MAG: tetratricopeptide repeat protein [Gemmatimonadales bacterium]|nr:MAG: tetratricopeptide repeat protein [Gemmatimonadales bacterium]
MGISGSSPTLLLALLLPVAGPVGDWTDTDHPTPLPAGSSAPVAVSSPADQLLASDSTQLHRDARNAQARFERIRVQHAPWSNWPSGGPCDEVVGRFCLRFPPEPRGGWTEDPSWRPPPEAREVVVAREELLMALARVAREHPGNDWVVGQRVRYLGEAGRWADALEVARDCQVPRPGWCAGLEGLALHHLGRVPEAESAFQAALDVLDPEDRERWLSLEWVVDEDSWGDLRRAEGPEREALEVRIWLYSNPLFLLKGNAFRTLHFSRRVEAELQAEARNPHGLSWGRDMEQMLVRYGPEVAYERVRDRSYVPGPVPVVGRYDPFSRGIVPTAAALRDPVAADPDAFSTVERRARSRHALPAAPTIHALASQVARFRRGDALLVVAAWELPHPLPVGPDSAAAEVGAETLASGVFLLPVDASSVEVLRQGESTQWDGSRGEGARGVATVQGPAEAHLLSVEVLDREGHRAWRHRQGTAQEPLHRDVVGLSDLLLLEPEPASGAPSSPEGDPGDRNETVDEVLEDHLPRAFPGSGVPPGGVEVAWEVYNLPPEVDRLRFRVTVEPDDRGLLRRAGEALRFLSPPAPVEVRWEEGRPAPARDRSASAETPLFRRVHLDLSGLESGRYRLNLSLSLPGRTETVSGRTLEIGG